MFRDVTYEPHATHDPYATHDPHATDDPFQWVMAYNRTSIPIAYPLTEKF